jgi:hypothetical protein
MNPDQVAKWKAAIAASRSQRRSRWRQRKRGFATVTSPGMLRLNPTQRRSQDDKPHTDRRDDAERAAHAAQELTRALYPALIEQDDGAELVDIQAWKDAGVLEVLRTAREFIDRVLRRLER